MMETFSSVPKVDFSRLKDPNARNEELLKLRDAIFVVGFLYLTNTGLEVRPIFSRVVLYLNTLTLRNHKS